MPSHVGTLTSPGEYFRTCGSVGPPESTTQTANRSVQLFLHNSRQKVPMLYNGRPFCPKLPLLMGDLDHNLIRGSLGQPESLTQTASRSVQPFLQGSLV